MKTKALRRAVDEFVLVSTGAKSAMGNTHLVELCWAAVSAVCRADGLDFEELAQRAERRAREGK